MAAAQKTELENLVPITQTRSVDRAFDDLYCTSYAPMVRLAHLLTSDAGAAEELAQDAFVETYRRFADLDNPGAFVRTVIVNRSRSWHRRRLVAASEGPPSRRTHRGPPGCHRRDP